MVHDTIVNASAESTVGALFICAPIHQEGAVSLNQAVEILRELRELAAEGVQLPCPDTLILRMEMSGHTIDLETGQVIIGGASVRRGLTVAAFGEVEGG